MQKACPIWSEWLTNWVFGASLEGSPTNESQRCRILKYVLWDKRRWRRRGLSVASRRPPQSPDVHVRSWHFATESYVRCHRSFREQIRYRAGASKTTLVT